MIEPRIREFLAAPRYAVLATVNPSGSPQLTEMWYGAAKKMTTYAIDATESLAKGAVEGQRWASSWTKDTPVAPLLEEQQQIIREFIERSADLTRRLWLLQLEQGEEAAERVEEEMAHLAQAQA